MIEGQRQGRIGQPAIVAVAGDDGVGEPRTLLDGQRTCATRGTGAISVCSMVPSHRSQATVSVRISKMIPR